MEGEEEDFSASVVRGPLGSFVHCFLANTKRDHIKEKENRDVELHGEG